MSDTEGQEEVSGVANRSQSQEGELESLRQQVAQLTALAEENRLLRERMTAQAVDHEAQISALMQRSIQLTVNPPVPAPRLGIFTGLKPTGGQEVDFPEWEQRVQLLMREVNSPSDALARVRGSLRGLAWEHVKSCFTAQEILNKLQDVYGSVRSSEELYTEFVQTKMDKKESPSAFLTRLWDKFIVLNKDNTYSEEEARKKVYYVFAGNLKLAHPMLALEVRNAFGHPGSASPDLTSVLKSVRQSEGSEPTTTPRATFTHAHHVGQTPEPIDYDKLADKVAERLRPGFKPKKPEGPCYRCGVVGQHFARDCTNPPNPAKVRQEREKSGRQQPLNINQSRVAGNL